MLDSYTEERLPSARAVIELSMELGKIICVPDPVEAAARDELMSAAVTDDATAIPPPPFLAGALLPADDPVAGHLFVQGNVASGGGRCRFDDVHGVGWRLVTIDDEPIELGICRWPCGSASIGGSIVAVDPADDVDGTYVDWFAAHGATWALQRPDFHVHGVAPDAAGATRAARRSAPPASTTRRNQTMKIASVKGRAALVLGDEIADIETASGGAFGADPMSPYADWTAFREFADSVTAGTGPLVEADLDCPVPRPAQVFAIGLNYRSHAEESGMELPDGAGDVHQVPRQPERAVRRRRRRRTGPPTGRSNSSR